VGRAPAHRQGAALVFDSLADRAVAREQMELRYREVTFLEHLDHGLTDETRGSHDGDSEIFAHWRVMSGVEDLTSAFWAR
jgi:hypothetical protein